MGYLAGNSWVPPFLQNCKVSSIVIFALALKCASSLKNSWAQLLCPRLASTARRSYMGLAALEVMRKPCTAPVKMKGKKVTLYLKQNLAQPWGANLWTPPKKRQIKEEEGMQNNEKWSWPTIMLDSRKGNSMMKRWLVEEQRKTFTSMPLLHLLYFLG